MITPEQREARRNHVGSSDIGALFGLDPFKPAGALDVYNTKVYDCVEDAEEENESIEIGNDVELPLIRWAGRKLGSPVITDPELLRKKCDEYPVLESNIDALLEYLPKTGIEGKSTSMVSAEWGTPGTDEVPDRVLLQAQAHMACHDLDTIYVPVLLGRFGLKRELYKVPRSEQLIEEIIKRTKQFWENNVLKRIPPEAGVAPSLEIIKRIRRVPATWAEVDASLVEQWEAAKKAKSEAEKAEKELLAQVLAQLGDAEGARLADGRELTYFLQSRTGVDAAKLQAEYPEVYQAVVKTSSFRVARTRKGK